jgi:hypothetical protein
MCFYAISGIIILRFKVKAPMYDKQEDTRKSNVSQYAPSNKDLEGNDKAPGEESGKGEEVTNDDLKGKKVDADPVYEQPIRQLP